MRFAANVEKLGKETICTKQNEKFIRADCWEERQIVSYHLFRFEPTGLRSVGMGRDAKIILDGEN